jgi:nucleotide-binding universal stress UspA family protein
MSKTDPKKRIMVAVDGSEGSNAAMDEAVALAKQLDAALSFAYVRRPQSSVLGHPYYERHLSDDLRKGREVIAEATQAAAAAGIESEGDVLEGDAADELVSLADSRDVDLIVIGSRGYGALAGALLGSVSREVVQHANVPVLVAKRRALPHAKVA